MTEHDGIYSAHLLKLPSQQVEDLEKTKRNVMFRGVCVHARKSLTHQRSDQSLLLLPLGKGGLSRNCFHFRISCCGL